MAKNKTKKAPKIVPTLPRRLSQEELGILYQVLSPVPLNGSRNTRIKADLLAWMEEQLPKPAPKPETQ